jgi:hypothetical protein
MLNWLLKLRRARGDARAVKQGPEAVGKRAGRRAINKADTARAALSSPSASMGGASCRRLRRHRPLRPVCAPTLTTDPAESRRRSA